MWFTTVLLMMDLDLPQNTLHTLPHLSSKTVYRIYLEKKYFTYNQVNTNETPFNTYTCIFRIRNDSCFSITTFKVFTSN